MFDAPPIRIAAVPHAVETGQPSERGLAPGRRTFRAAAIARRRDAETIRALQMELEAQQALVREQAASLAHSRRIFAEASAAARIGVWECSLPDERLRWTDTVYDLFDLPRGSPLDRTQTLFCYAQPSLQALEAARSRAIAARSGFNLDAEIVTAKGRQRWIRLTATVECRNDVAVRIFGMKQDITEEKAQADRTRRLAECDAMTGLANRALFEARLSRLGGGADGPNPLGALLLIDLDGFKRVNDTFGHALGDECLKEVAFRLQRVCRAAELVARIGGDEFAVLLGAHLDRKTVERLAGRIVEALRQPVDRGGQTLKLGASVGVAHADGCAVAELFTRADTALYAAKAAGRNTFRMFSPAMGRATGAVGTKRSVSARFGTGN